MSPKAPLATAALLVASLVLASSAIAAPNFRSSSSVSTAAAVGSLTLPAPAGVAAGDVMIAGIEARITYSIAVTAPAGWTLVRREASALPINQLLYYRIAGSAEPASYTFSFGSVSTATAVIVAYSGVSIPFPVDAHRGLVAAAQTSVVAPSVTTALTGDILVGLFGTAGSSVATPPTGMAQRAAAVSTASKPATIMLADQQLGAPGATGDRAASAPATVEVAVGQLIALRPSLTAAPASPPVTTPPTSTMAPALTGTAQEGLTLTATSGSWSGTTPMTYAYAWSRCDASGGACTALPGATSSNYVVAAADVGATVRVAATASNSAGSAVATSAPTTLVAAVPVVAPPSNVTLPAVSGTAQADQTLAATSGSWTGTTPMTYAYAWQRCDAAGGACTAIADATARTYVVTFADVDATLEVAVTATNSAGSVTASSDPTALVAALPVAPPPSNVTVPTVSGTAQADQTLAATSGSWTGTTPMTYTYAWQRCNTAGACTAIAGANAWTYLLTSADVGSTIRVAVTASDVVGSATAMSAATAVVVAVPLPPAPVPAPPPTPLGGLVSDDFNNYASGAKITDSSTYLFANFPGGGTSGPSNPSSIWETDTGWLYADSGWGYSGRPIDWPDRWFFRLNTRNFGLGNGSVSWKYRSAPFGQNGYAVESADAVDVWLRYQTQYNLYIIQFDRTNNCLVAKRKVPGDGWRGSSSLIVNHGIYYTLKTDSAQPVFGAGQQCITWGGLGLSNLAHDSTTAYSFKATVTTLASGNVQLQLWRDGKLVFSITDANDGTNASGATMASDLAAGYFNTVPGWQASWGKPITASGSVGFRADNIKLWLDDFVVQPS